jgi:hypothetical protein
MLLALSLVLIILMVLSVVCTMIIISYIEVTNNNIINDIFDFLALMIVL